MYPYPQTTIFVPLSSDCNIWTHILRLQCLYPYPQITIFVALSSDYYMCTLILRLLYVYPYPQIIICVPLSSDYNICTLNLRLQYLYPYPQITISIPLSSCLCVTILLFHPHASLATRKNNLLDLQERIPSVGKHTINCTVDTCTRFHKIE